MDGELSFVAPEGVYTTAVSEDIKPAPAIVPIPANAPLHLTKLTTITVRFPPVKEVATGFAQLFGGGNKDKEKEKPRDDESSSSGTRTADNSGSPEVQPIEIPPTEAQGMFTVNTNRKKQNVKPKHNIRTTSSTFIARVVAAEGLSKALSNKFGDVTFIFYNSGKSFVWVEAGQKTKEPLTRVSFSAFPTCHDVNTTTASPDRLELLIGFNTGDVIWFDVVCSRYARLNKGGSITSSPCTTVRWVSGSPNLFLVAHADGTCILYDKEREDGAFTVDEPDDALWDPLDTVLVTPHKNDSKTLKNPLSHWRISKKKIVDLVFSPDVKYIAVVAEDGCLRVIDAQSEQLVGCYASYFGAITCVRWSPDGRYILTGGQDDLLTITSPWEQRVVARFQGHSSFISAVAWDEARCGGRRYRFGSVGQDNKLILWDFSSSGLPRPRRQMCATQRVSMSSALSLGLRRGSLLHLPHSEGDGSSILPSKFHPAPPRNEVAFVQPVVVKFIDTPDYLSDIAFLPKVILTAGKAGLTKNWSRPPALGRAKTGSKKSSAAKTAIGVEA